MHIFIFGSTLLALFMTIPSPAEAFFFDLLTNLKGSLADDNDGTAAKFNGRRGSAKIPNNLVGQNGQTQNPNKDEERQLGDGQLLEKLATWITSNAESLLNAGQKKQEDGSEGKTTNQQKSHNIEEEEIVDQKKREEKNEEKTTHGGEHDPLLS